MAPSLTYFLRKVLLKIHEVTFSAELAHRIIIFITVYSNSNDHYYLKLDKHSTLICTVLRIVRILRFHLTRYVVSHFYCIYVSINLVLIYNLFLLWALLLQTCKVMQCVNYFSSLFVQSIGILYICYIKWCKLFVTNILYIMFSVIISFLKLF